jgi:hypothetical protein
MPNIDPSKTAKADKDYIQMGASTPDTVARNWNGSSGAANRAANKRQIPELEPVPWDKKQESSAADSPDEEGGGDDGGDDEKKDGRGKWPR